MWRGRETSAGPVQLWSPLDEGCSSTLVQNELVIAGDLPILREVLDDDIAVLADPEDIDTWYTVIQHVAKDPQWAQSRSAAARLFAAQHSRRAGTRWDIPLP